jgi:hypothetical protein
MRMTGGGLKRVLKYIHGTKCMPLIMRAESLNAMKWLVDASFATHNDCRGRTGVTMSLGNGYIMGMSKKQKINTKFDGIRVGRSR